MISDLIGKTTEPVMRNRMISVVPTTIASASGRWSLRLDWKSTKCAAPPVTSTVAPGGAGRSRIRFTVDLLASEMNELLEIAFTSVTPPSSRCGGSTAAIPGSRSTFETSWSTAFGGELDRAVAERGEVRAHHVVDLAGAGALGQHLRIDRGELDAEERDAERDQGHGAEGRDGDGPAHYEAGEPVPEALTRLSRVPLGAPLQEARGERVHARSEDAEDGRQDHQRHRRREQRNQRAPDPHRVQEPLRKDDQ